MSTATAMIVVLLCGVGLVLCFRALIRLHPRGRRTPPRVDEAGVVTVEFALVMPVILFLILILTQTALLMAAQFFVHYAAFAAVRVAVVQIPRDLSAVGGEAHNVIDAAPGSPKFDAMTRAAQIAVMPISGRDESSRVDVPAFAAAWREHFELLDQTPPRWVDTLAAERMAYAVEHIEVELLRVESLREGVTLEPIFGTHAFTMRQTVAVRVRHRLNLAVPYVRAIFADDYHRTLHGETAYADVAATASLTVEGVDPALPVEPALPRRDRHRNAT